MFKKILLVTALLFTAGAGVSQAQWFRPPDNYYQRVARDWVQLYLGRNPTQREVLLIVNQLRAGASSSEVQANILGSEEYYIRSGRNLNTWANRIVADSLGRPATAWERGTLSNLALQNGRVNAALVVLLSRYRGWGWGW